ncbi:hypothetical protein C8J56DRAFT_901985 [Mycena floridula]|nr:hypothetical protein C8J56DRAFT_901985 [Mycena floridula]
MEYNVNMNYGGGPTRQATPSPYHPGGPGYGNRNNMNLQIDGHADTYLQYVSDRATNTSPPGWSPYDSGHPSRNPERPGEDKEAMFGESGEIRAENDNICTTNEGLQAQVSSMVGPIRSKKGGSKKGNEGSVRATCHTEIEKPVHRAMYSLIDMTFSRTTKQTLPEPGESFTRDDVTFFRPDWTKKYNDDSVKVYLKAVTTVVANEINESEGMKAALTAKKADFSDTAIDEYVRTYWGTMALAYKAQTNEESAQNRVINNTRNRILHRRNGLVNMLVEGLPAFKAKYGAENCVGIESLIRAEYLDEPRNNVGEADTE